MFFGAVSFVYFELLTLVLSLIHTGIKMSPLLTATRGKATNSRLGTVAVCHWRQQIWRQWQFVAVDLSPAWTRLKWLPGQTRLQNDLFIIVIYWCFCNGWPARWAFASLVALLDLDILLSCFWCLCYGEINSMCWAEQRLCIISFSASVSFHLTLWRYVNFIIIYYYYNYYYKTRLT